MQVNGRKGVERGEIRSESSSREIKEGRKNDENSNVIKAREHPSFDRANINRELGFVYVFSNRELKLQTW